MGLAEQFIAHSAQMHGVTFEQMKSKVRGGKDTMKARRVASYLCFKELDMTKSDIGRLVGRDHSSICSQIAAIEISMTPALEGQIKMVRDLSLIRHAQCSAAITHTV